MLGFFSLTLFVSATLLFFVQPMIGKMLLPRLGGTPAVWNTCMVFFQAMLLVGYGYTHTISTTQQRRRQLLIQAIVLFLPLLVLPFALGDRTPPAEDNPVFWLLWVLLGMVGLPFFVVATTAPLLQRWFATTGHPAAKDPYFLYGASNFGSMLGLLAYPALIEPIWDVPTQAIVWTAGYALFVALVLTCAYLVWRSPEPVLAVVDLTAEPTVALDRPSSAQPAPVVAASTAVMTGRRRGARLAPAGLQPTTPSLPPRKPLAAPSLARRLGDLLLAKENAVVPATDHITVARRFRWVLLAAAPSSLMLGTTTYLTTDIAAVPFFWVIPLALYLLTFILVFARWPIVWTDKPHSVMLYLQPCFLLFLVLRMVAHLQFPSWFWPVACEFVLNLAAFFTTALVCHGELAKDRPSARHLTEFFLWMSVGAVLGGLFNALIAPLALPYGIVEYPIAMVAACLLRPYMVHDVTQAESLTHLDRLAQVPSLLLEAPMFVLGMATASTGTVPADAPPSLGARLLGYVRRASQSNLLEILLDFVVPVAFGYFAYVLLDVGDHQRTYFGITFRRSYMMAFAVVITLAMMMRPVRFGLSIGALFLVVLLYDRSYENLVFEDRGFFGLVRVREHKEEERGPNGRFVARIRRTLIHGGINHGQQLVWPEALRREPITYFHPTNGIGEIFHKLTWGNPPGQAGTPEHKAWLEKYFWTDPPQQAKGETEAAFEKRSSEWNDTFVKLRGRFYPGDPRLPASLVGLGAVSPWAQLVGTQQQPPYAVIGLGAGTLAAHAQPYQHVDFFEIDPIIKRLSVPASGNAEDLVFYFVDDALKREARLSILMGDGRRKMMDAPERFYHAMLIDAFSSDAVPVHLLTREAVELYLDKLADGGVLIFNTTNRYVDLPPVLARIAEELNLECLHCPDYGNDDHLPEKYGADWLALRRRDKTPGVYRGGGPSLYDRLHVSADRWHTVTPFAGRAWTDGYSNLLSVLRW